MKAVFQELGAGPSPESPSIPFDCAHIGSPGHRKNLQTEQQQTELTKLGKHLQDDLFEDIGSWTGDSTIITIK